MTPRVLVTGASGFIGWHATRLLAEKGFEVHASARHRPIDLPEGATFHHNDLLADGATALVKAVRPSHLLHFAWNAEAGAFWNAPNNVDWLAASLGLYRAFADAGGKRSVFAGSCAEYDWSKPTLSEHSTPLAPASLYGVCKDALRRAVEKAAAQDGISFAWGRIFWLYGPRERRGRLVSDLIAGLLDGCKVPCSEGSQCRDFMHVEDVASAFVQLLMSDARGPINIGSGKATRVADVIALTAELIGRPELVELGALPSGPNQPPTLVADNQYLKDAVGFSPNYALRDGLSETIEWWKIANRKN